MAEPTLFTFPPSLDSEFSRFVLRHYGITAHEERHVILFQSLVTLVRAGTPRIPTLQGAGPRPLDKIVKIVNYLEARAQPERNLLAGDGSPPSEVRAVEHAYPVFAFTLRVLLRLTAQRAAEARDTIRSALGKIDGRLSDGRSYLYGDRFTMHDMAFAIAAAPTIWPDNYGGPLPPLSATPAPVQELVAECRARPSGAFALRIYHNHRDSG
jgi:glutathione S-transferase